MMGQASASDLSQVILVHCGLERGSRLLILISKKKAMTREHIGLLTITITIVITNHRTKDVNIL